MPDIRIKDLTTEASASVTSDFLPIDGNTGTRKLSAFNPSFGGNATVGGTLTVNSTFASSASSTTLTSQFANTLTGAANILNLQLRRGDSANGFSRLMWGTGATTEWSLGSRSGDTNLYFWDEVANAERLKIASSSGIVTISSTTASTSTSSGALVVGNGTSGGLGVGGNVNIGGTVGVGTATDATIGINSQPTISSGSFQYGVYSAPTINASTADSGFFSMRTAASSTVGSAFVLRAFTPTLGSSSTITTATGLRIENIGATGVTNAYGIDIAAQSGASSTNVGLLNAGTTRLTNTTASTSTSSGALVVSGGVGVAKRIFTGEGLDTAGDNATHISLVRNGTISIGPTSAATPKLQVGGGLLLANTSQSVPAYGDVGPQLSVAGAVITDTSSSGTVSRAVVNSIAASALAASSTTTYTAAASLFVAGAPTANTNVTITNAYAIYTAGGRINFQGLPTSSAGLQAGTLWNDGGTLKIA